MGDRAGQRDEAEEEGDRGNCGSGEEGRAGYCKDHAGEGEGAVLVSVHWGIGHEAVVDVGLDFADMACLAGFGGFVGFNNGFVTALVYLFFHSNERKHPPTVKVTNCSSRVTVSLREIVFTLQTSARKP